MFWSHWMGGSVPSISALDDSGSAGHWQVKVKHKHWHFLEGRTPGTQSSRLSSLQLLNNNIEMIPQPKHSASGKIRKACFPGVDPVITHVMSIVLETLQVGDLAGSLLWTVQLVWVLELGVLVKSGRRREALASPILAGSPQPCLLVYFVKQPWFLSSAAEVVHPWRGWGQASPFLSGLLTQSCYGTKTGMHCTHLPNHEPNLKCFSFAMKKPSQVLEKLPSEASLNWNPNPSFSGMIDLAQNRKITISIEINWYFAESRDHLHLGASWFSGWVNRAALQCRVMSRHWGLIIQVFIPTLPGSCLEFSKLLNFSKPQSLICRKCLINIGATIVIFTRGYTYHFWIEMTSSAYMT